MGFSVTTLLPPPARPEAFKSLTASTTPDGRIDILVYHARSYRDIVGDPLNNPDRATRAQHLPFDSAGMPLFGVPVADGPYQVDVLP